MPWPASENSQHPENLSPYGDHSQEKGERCERKSLLNNSANHGEPLCV
jgi:hypothetical protein